MRWHFGVLGILISMDQYGDDQPAVISNILGLILSLPAAVYRRAHLRAGWARPALMSRCHAAVLMISR